MTTIQDIDPLEYGDTSLVKIEANFNSLNDNKVEKVSGQSLTDNNFTDTDKSNLDSNTTHRGQTNNPHSVTKAQVGLSSVPNLDTTDAVNNEHTHSNKTVLDLVVANGDGTKYLSDDGTYNTIIPVGATVDVGTTNTGTPSTDATVTNSGTTTDVILDFVIPRGATGISGGAGTDGAFAYDYQEATEGQTVFTLTYEYTSGTNNLFILVNGVKQIITKDYTETDDTTVTFSNGLTAGDEVEFIFLNKGIVWEGAYNDTVTYLKDRAVSYNGSSYISIQETTGNLPTDTVYWNILASKGDTGQESYTDAEIKTKYENNTDTNAFTDTEKTKLAGIEEGAETNNISDTDATDLTDLGESNLHYHSSDRDRANHTGLQTASTISDFDTEVSNNSSVSANTTHKDTTSGNPHSVTKTDVGLGNVDNTADADKPISTATQGALDGKEDGFTKNTGFNKDFGTTSGTVSEGNHIHGITKGKETATSGQTAFTVSSYTAGRISVYINGILQIVTDDYTETDSTTITLTTGATSGDVFTYIIF